jgi:ParB family transcriptional regulator, chromosome partitioning protein
MIRKSQLTENRLLFIVTALKKLFQDENFLTLWKAEQLETLAVYLAERIQVTDAA